MNSVSIINKDLFPKLLHTITAMENDDVMSYNGIPNITHLHQTYVDTLNTFTTATCY